MHNKISIKPYTSVHKKNLILLLEENIPKFFSEEEKSDFIHYLDNETEDYFVLLLESTIIGCGGINLSEDKKTGKISWDILSIKHQGKGFGTTLLKHRIFLLKEKYNVEKITVRTSQLAYMFYKKNGFELREVKKDFWVKGFDLYYMVYKN